MRGLSEPRETLLMKQTAKILPSKIALIQKTNVHNT